MATARGREGSALLVAAAARRTDDARVRWSQLVNPADGLFLECPPRGDVNALGALGDTAEENRCN
jgi:hypothetical protein